MEAVVGFRANTLARSLAHLNFPFWQNKKKTTAKLAHSRSELRARTEPNRFENRNEPIAWRGEAIPDGGTLLQALRHLLSRQVNDQPDF